MSTQIGRISGSKESFIGQQKVEHELYLTRFFGGTKRGTSLQLTITGDGKSDYIQLDNESVRELIQILIEEFPDQKKVDWEGSMYKIVREDIDENSEPFTFCQHGERPENCDICN